MPSRAQLLDQLAVLLGHHERHAAALPAPRRCAGPRGRSRPARRGASGARASMRHRQFGQRVVARSQPARQVASAPAASACSGSTALNSSGLSAIEMQRAGEDQALRLPAAAGPATRPAPARMKENSPICARLRRHRQRRVAADSAARSTISERGQRLADHDDRRPPPAPRSGCVAPAPSGRTACRPRRRTAPRTRRAAAAISSAARWLSSDSRSTMPAKKAPSANDTPNSSADAVGDAEREPRSRTA